VSQSEYQLGHDPAELDRLNQQGGLLAPATRMLLQAAGIGPGMRVLDLGSGSGDHAFAVAGLVGPDGSVAGVERSADAVALARARAEQLGLGNVTFTAGDIHDPAGGGPFDAVTGRLVLMYVPDPAAVLRAQAGVLRPGGLIAPVEFDVSTARTLPPVPLAYQARDWVIATFQRAGIEPALGARLWQVLTDAGARPAGMLGVQPHFGPDHPGGPALLGGVVRTLMPVIKKTWVATAEEVGPDTLVQRLAAELAGNQAVFAHPMLMSAWGTVG
jgi:ubiquinone/menaquinone biosynthesis C-methylase UbiE